MLDTEYDMKRRHLRDMVNCQKLNYSQLRDRYSITNDVKYQIMDKDDLTHNYRVLEFLAPYVLVESKADGDEYLVTFQHAPRYYFAPVKVLDNKKVEQNWETELLNLMSHWSWYDVESEEDMYSPLIKSGTFPCTDCSNVSLDKENICLSCNNTGTIRKRSSFVNAKKTFYTCYRDNQFLLMRFDNWFHLSILSQQIKQDPDTLRLPKPYIQAITTEWSGEQAGSAIKRHPENLRGFMYRVTGHQLYQLDVHVRPHNIMDYLVDKVDELADK